MDILVEDGGVCDGVDIYLIRGDNRRRVRIAKMQAWQKADTTTKWVAYLYDNRAIKSTPRSQSSSDENVLGMFECCVVGKILLG